MRRAYRDQTVVTENGQFMGVVLGYDYCAEHEWGIREIKRDFSIPHVPSPECCGLPARTITEVPEHYFVRQDKKTKDVLFGMIHRWYGDDPNEREFVGLREVACIYEKEPFAAAWSETGFLLRVREQDRHLVDDLYAAMQRKDLAIYGVAQRNPFGGSGLALVIPSRVPDHYKQLMAEADLDNIALSRAAEATGVHVKLKEAGLDYFALSPRWRDESKTDVVFWLNPMDQRHHNYGWFSAADLEAWARGEGPIPKRSASV